jgi:hypothetical protein
MSWLQLLNGVGKIINSILNLITINKFKKAGKDEQFRENVIGNEKIIKQVRSDVDSLSFDDELLSDPYCREHKSKS